MEVVVDAEVVKLVHVLVVVAIVVVEVVVVVVVVVEVVVVVVVVVVVFSSSSIKAQNCFSFSISTFIRCSVALIISALRLFSISSSRFTVSFDKDHSQFEYYNVKPPIIILIMILTLKSLNAFA